MTPLAFIATLGVTQREGRSPSLESGPTLVYALRLAEYLRREAEWRRGVATKHSDLQSNQTARGFDQAAAEIEQLTDDHPWLMALVEAGWLTADGFVPVGDSATRYLGQFRRHGNGTWEELLFSLAIYAGGEDVWRGYATTLRGRARRFDLILTPLRPQDTRLPQWESYSLRASQMGTNRIAQETLLGIDRYLTALEAPRQA